MAFSNGTYTLYATGNPVVTGTTISSSWANNTLNDIATALSTCLLKDGTQTATASVPFAAGASFAAAVTMATTLAVTGTTTFTGVTTHGGNVVSDTDSTDDLGTTTVRWANLYVDSIGDSGQGLDVDSADVRITDGVLLIKEQAEADADQAGYGQWWVDTATPNIPMFTDDAGTDHRLGIGKQTIWVPAGAMISRTTNGAATGTVEETTNKNMLKTLDFDQSTQEFAQFTVAFNKGWDEGTVTFIPFWSHTSGGATFGVVWALQGIAVSNDDTQDVAFGTEQTSTDTGGTAEDLYVGPESSAITIGGTPAAGDEVMFQIKRNVSDGSDTLDLDARLQGVKIIYTCDTPTDD